MSSVYGTIETAIVTAINAEEDCPFASTSVRAIGSQLGVADLARIVDNLHTIAPAVLVLCRGSDMEPGHSGELVKVAQFAMVVVEAGRTPEAVLRGDNAGTGVYELVEWLIDLLDAADIDGIPNQLLYQQDMPLPRDVPATVAAWMVVFKTQVRSEI